MRQGTISVFHSGKDNFCVVATVNPSQGSAPWYVILKDDLTMENAKEIASELRKVLEIKDWSRGYISGFAIGEGI